MAKNRGIENGYLHVRLVDSTAASFRYPLLGISSTFEREPWCEVRY